MRSNHKPRVSPAAHDGYIREVDGVFEVSVYTRLGRAVAYRKPFAFYRDAVRYVSLFQGIRVRGENGWSYI